MKTLILAIYASLLTLVASASEKDGTKPFNYILGVSENYLYFKVGGNDTTLQCLNLKSKQRSSIQIPERISKQIINSSQINFSNHIINNYGFCNGDTLFFLTQYVLRTYVTPVFIDGATLITTEEGNSTFKNIVLKYLPSTEHWEFSILQTRNVEDLIIPFSPKILLNQHTKFEENNIEQRTITVNNQNLIPTIVPEFTFDNHTTFEGTNIASSYWSMSINYHFPLIYYNESPYIKIFEEDGTNTTLDVSTYVVDATQIISAHANKEILNTVVQKKDRSIWNYTINVKTKTILQRKKIHTTIQLRNLLGIVNGYSNEKEVLSNVVLINDILYYFDDQNKLNILQIDK